ncbi:hypothetical protein D9757_003873 [Collybiopsis confluens]|uniref:Uncharacterized protein n=1 Tax=Collybiopsis confluens TaxID=2823264 RepID=A0A8H5MDW6_9AGAR|nr:hypothetical protein D9757_003873 [Collybiopsis confluens]
MDHLREIIDLKAPIRDGLEELYEWIEKNMVLTLPTTRPDWWPRDTLFDPSIRRSLISMTHTFRPNADEQAVPPRIWHGLYSRNRENGIYLAEALKGNETGEEIHRVDDAGVSGFTISGVG